MGCVEEAGLEALVGGSLLGAQPLLLRHELTAIEEAAHRDTTPQRLLELANSTSSDVLIVVATTARRGAKGKTCEHDRSSQAARSAAHNLSCQISRPLP